MVSALAAVGGAVWTLNPEGQLALQYQINIQETRLRESEEHQAQHGRLLYKALAGGEGMLVPPHSGPGQTRSHSIDETPAANPTEFLLVLGLLKTDLETVGLVEIFQRAEAGPSTQKGYLRFLMQMCELAGDFLKSHQLRHFSDRQTLWTQLEDFTRAVHASLDPREAAYTIANEGRRLIECDRVSVAIRKGKKCKIEAISGQDLFDKRSNTVRLLGKLATAVVASGDAVWYTGDTRDLPPQVEDAVQEYVDEAHSKTVAVLPLRRPAPPEEDDPKKRVEAGGADRGADRRADRGQPRVGEPGAAGGRGLPAQFHRVGQRPGASELVPDAGVAGVGQDPLGAPGPHPAQDAEHRRRRAAGAAGPGDLAGAVHAGVEGHARTGGAAGRLRRHRRRGARTVLSPTATRSPRTNSSSSSAIPTWRWPSPTSKASGWRPTSDCSPCSGRWSRRRS